jgi:hypothetical protein
MRRLIVSLLFISTLLTLVPARAQTAVTITIGGERGAISPYVYGANYGPWSLVSMDMFPKAVTAGVTFYRYPGGNWGDDNDLNSFHLDMYAALYKQSGAVPSLSVRLKNGIADKAADLVRLVNIERKLGITWWSIGNEPDLFPNPDVQTVSKQWREIALAMRKVDPTIKFIGPEVSQFPPNDRPNPYLDVRREWVREFLKINGDLVDVVSIHRYPFPLTNTSTTSIAELRANVPEWGTMIVELRKVIKEATGREIPVAVTEANSHWSNTASGEATPDSYYNAIWWAGALAQLIQQRVEIVTYFTLSTGNENGFGLLSRFEPRPTYYTYQIYQHFGSLLLEAQSSDPDVVVLVAKNGDGALTVLLVNLADNVKTFTVQATDPLLQGKLGAPPSEIWRLDADHKAEKVTDAKLTLPKQSVTLYLYP